MVNCAIAISGLTVDYRVRRRQIVRAVDNLSFTVQPGEIVGFLGPNGAGKSSTIKAMMGFTAPSAGRASLFGEDAGSITAKRHVGYLPEVALYYPYLSPLETLRLYGTLQGIDATNLEREACELLEVLGISESMHKLNRSLSKGMLQRVGVAQALLGNPKLLVLDEVTSGLDPIGRQQLREILAERREQGTTLFFSSHELAEVEMLCDRIIVIEHGRIIDERNVQELKEELTVYSLRFRGTTELNDIAHNIVHESENVVFAEFSNKHDLLLAISRINGSRGVITDVIAKEGSMEEYFIETVSKAA